MKNFTLGCCTYTVDGEFQRAPRDMLYKLADLGYTSVELGYFSPLGTRELKDTLRKAGLRVTSIHMDFDTQSRYRAHVMDFANEIGARYLGIPVPKEGMTDADGYKAGAEAFNELGKVYKENGFKLIYHNHHMEFQNWDGKTGHDILFENTDPEYVGFQLDTFWLAIAGLKPEEYIKKFKGRTDVIHFKDKKKGADDVCAVGSGELDFDAILKSTEEIGTHTILVEQDGGCFEDAKSSYEYLHKLLKS